MPINALHGRPSWMHGQARPFPWQLLLCLVILTLAVLALATAAGSRVHSEASVLLDDLLASSGAR